MIPKFRSWWKDKVKPLKITGLIVLLIGLFSLIIIVIAGYTFSWNWTGLGPFTPPHPYESSFQRGKTLWDWLQLLIIPVVLAVASYLFNLTVSRNEQKSTQLRDQTERDISLDNQRETALQQYIDKMSELLLNNNLRESPIDNEVRKIARVRTLTVLPRLDANRKRSIVLFLGESDLIVKNKPIIVLKEADLSKVNFSFANLSGANLSGANLSEVSVDGADLSEVSVDGADFSHANLSDADLSSSHMRDANFSYANFSGTNLSKIVGLGTNFSHTNFSKTDLRNATLAKANFIFTTLTEVDFSKARLFTADLSNAKLVKVNFDGALLNKVELSDANLTEVELTSYQLDNTFSNPSPF